MQIAHLHYFNRVAETGNVTAAAESLHISQPQLSRILGELEREMGVRLLDRSSKGVALTASGQAFYLSSKKILGDCEEGFRLTRDASDESVVHFVLGTTIDFYMPGYVKHLLHQIPNAMVKQVYGQRGELTSRLLSQNIGSLITTPGLNISTQLESLTLLEDRLVAVYPEGHAFTGRACIGLHDMEGQAQVSYSAGYGVRPAIDELLDAAKLASRRLVVETGDTSAIVEYVRSGLGVAVLPAIFAESDAFCAGHMVPFAPEIPLPICVSWIRDRKLRPVDLQYKEILQGYFANLGGC